MTRQCLEDGASNLGRAGRIDEQSQATMQKGFTTAVVFAGDHWHAAGHGLEEDKAESFPTAWHHVDIGEVVEIRLLALGNEIGKDDMFGQAEMPCLLL